MNTPFQSPIAIPHFLTGEILSETLAHLRLHGQETLRKKSRDQIVQTLAEISRCWCRKTYSFRKKALKLLPENTGFSREMIERGIDLTFSKINAETLFDYTDDELGTPSQPVSGLIGHIAPGNLFPPIIQSLFHGLLVQSPNFIRTSEQDLHFPVLLVQSLVEADPELADALAVAHWSSANQGLNARLAKSVDTLVVYGSDSTLEKWRALSPRQKRFVGFGHKLSIGFVSHSGLENVAELGRHAALDVAMYDQQGCLSPHCFFLENPSPQQWIEFGTRLFEELRKLETELPVSQLSEDMEFIVGNLRQKYIFKSSLQPESYKAWFTKTSPSSVFYENESHFLPSCLGRTIWIRPVGSLLKMVEALEPWSGKLQCLGADSDHENIRKLLPILKNLGFSRICRIGSMQAPPITWPNGGSSMLKQLIS